ncbi:MAG TPA: outer membrane protein assembly factor BamD [Opitutus sp.]|nr:outer membrane protein assembly factor BamD [Opitutus sp.]
MRFDSARAPRFWLFLSSLCLLFAATARADVVWHPDTGWQIEGGVLAGVTGPAARNALELMNRAREAEERGSIGSALRSYKRVTKKHPSSAYASEALYRTGKLYLLRKQYFKSFTAFAQTIATYPNTKHFNDIIGEEYRIASALLDGARNRYWGIIPGFQNRTRALEYFEVIVQSAPYSDYAPLALMNKARGQLKQRDIEEAIDSLDRMINLYPNSLLAPDAYLRLAQTHAQLVDGPRYDQGSTKEAITYFEDFLILFPNDANVPKAAEGLDKMKQVLSESKIVIGDFYFHKRRNYTAARVFYNEAITAYPDSPVAERARVKLAQVEASAAGGENLKKKKRFFFF